MPLIFKAKANDNPNNPWRELGLSTFRGLLIWEDDHSIVGNEPNKYMQTVNEQAHSIIRDYNVFAYRDERLFHPPTSAVPSIAAFLNRYGDKPNFTKKTLERGWMASNGDFIGCNHGCHADLLNYTLGITANKAKQEGWVMIQPDFIFLSNPEGRLTQEQRDTLKKLQFFEGDKPGHFSRKDIPHYNEDFERVRVLYAGTEIGDIPVLMEPDAALPIMENVRAGLEQLAFEQMAFVALQTRPLLTQFDSAQLSENGGKINDLMLKVHEDFERIQRTIRQDDPTPHLAV